MHKHAKTFYNWALVNLVLLLSSAWSKMMFNKTDDSIAKIKLPSESNATSVLRGPHRPLLTGVGDKPLWNGSRSYSLNKSSGDNGSNLGTEEARTSRGWTLNERNGGDWNGGTLTARDGARDQGPAIKMECAFAQKYFVSSFQIPILEIGLQKSDKETIQWISVQRSHL